MEEFAAELLQVHCVARGTRIERVQRAGILAGGDEKPTQTTWIAFGQRTRGGGTCGQKAADRLQRVQTALLAWNRGYWKKTSAWNCSVRHSRGVPQRRLEVCCTSGRIEILKLIEQVRLEVAALSAARAAESIRLGNDPRAYAGRGSREIAVTVRERLPQVWRSAWWRR